MRKLSKEEAAALGLDEPDAAAPAAAPKSRALSQSDAIALGLEKPTVGPLREGFSPAAMPGVPRLPAQDSLPEAVEARKVSRPMAALAGAGDYASGGFNDEIGGLAGALADKVGLTSRPEIVRAQTREGETIPNARADALESETFGDKYRGYRDAIRTDKAKSREDRPVYYHGAGLAAGLLNPLGRGAGTLGSAVKTGAVQGLGGSDADLTTGDLGQVGRAALDTGVGAAAGAALHGITKGVLGAKPKVDPEELQQRVLNEIKQGDHATVTPTAGKRLHQAGEAITDEVQSDPRFRTAYVGKPAKEGVKGLDPLINDAQTGNDAAYQQFKAAGKAFDPVSYADGLRKRAKAAFNSGDSSMGDGLEHLADKMDHLAKKADPGALDLKALRKFTTNTQAAAALALGGLNDTGAATKLKRQLSAVASEEMADHLAAAAKGNPALEAAAQAIREGNKKINAGATAKGALKTRLYKEASQRPPLERAVEFATHPLKKALPAAARKIEQVRTTQMLKNPNGRAGLSGRQAGVLDNGLSPALLRTLGLGSRRRPNDEETDQ